MEIFSIVGSNRRRKELIKMTGSLQIKNDKYYAVINYYENGKRKQKWICSNLTVKGNKTRADKFLREQIAIYESKAGLISSDILFSDYIKIWLERINKSVDAVTYQGYEQLAKSHIIPYFEQNKICLQDLNKDHLQAYVDEKAKNGRLDNKGGLSGKSLKLHRNILNQTLKEALKSGLISINPCQWVKFPQIQRREPTFYTAEQVEKLLSVINNDSIFYLLVKITATYGLRRSEILGLQWNSINFERDTFQISHTVVKVNETVCKDKTKNASSFRSFPLIPEIKQLLIEEKTRQQKNRKEFGKSYIDSSYVFVWDNGKPYATEYISQHFKRILKRNNLPHIRFHDLRHSCASILLSRGFTLKDVQEWLGHSDITLTANIYGHLDIARKRTIADTMANVF